MNQPDLPQWAYWLLVPVVIAVLILYAVIRSDYKPRYDKRPRKKK